MNGTLGGSVLKDSGRIPLLAHPTSSHRRSQRSSICAFCILDFQREIDDRVTHESSRAESTGLTTDDRRL
jgi:hypothetical protein